MIITKNGIYIFLNSDEEIASFEEQTGESVKDYDIITKEEWKKRINA